MEEPIVRKVNAALKLKINFVTVFFRDTTPKFCNSSQLNVFPNKRLILQTIFNVFMSSLWYGIL